MTDGNGRNSRLRIVHSESSMGWGGQEIRILTESQGMIERGHDVRILCPPDAKVHEAARQRGIPVEALPIRRRTFKALGAVRAWLRSNRVDVINTHSSTDSWLFCTAARLVFRPAPTVRTRHIGAPVSRDLFTRWLYVHGARMVVACGSRMREVLVGHNRFPADRVVSVPTGIDTGRFSPGDRAAARRKLDLPADKTILGVLATIRSGKGHKYLLDALRLLSRDDLLALFVGDGPYRPQVEQHARELGVADRVVMAGNQQDVLSWLRAMDVLVLPSYAVEGVPQALMQAASCGLPVVATAVGSIGDAVEHGQTGLIVPPEDARSLADALASLVDDAALRVQFGTAARQRALEQFGIESMLDRMEDVFRRVAAAA